MYKSENFAQSQQNLVQAQVHVFVTFRSSGKNKHFFCLTGVANLHVYTHRSSPFIIIYKENSVFCYVSTTKKNKRNYVRIGQPSFCVPLSLTPRARANSNAIESAFESRSSNASLSTSECERACGSARENAGAISSASARSTAGDGLNKNIKMKRKKNPAYGRHQLS